MVQRNYTSGLTLLELAIVLVIIGLVVASATAGRHLIKQAELKNIIQDFENYNASIHTFREKYYSWPGDIPNATEFWDTATCPTPQCNGNGDDHILGGTGGPNQNEGYRAWQHLVLAGMVHGNFDGLGRSGGNEAIIGENVPASPRTEGGYFLHYWGIPDKANALTLGAFQAGTYNAGAILTPDDAHAIDEKMDDGLPREGKLWAMGNGGAGNCYTAAAYNLSDDTIQCALHLWIDEQ